MRCIVTAGPTWEPLDHVRRLTNFSTGSLGGTLANALAMAGHGTTLLLSESATWSSPVAAVEVHPFSTTATLADALKSLSDSGPAAVFHAAAVSDFTAGRLETRGGDGTPEVLTAGKVDSRGGPVWVQLVPTPKILPRLREWFPAGRITGWKYEVDGSEADAVARGAAQLSDAGSDACVVNGPACGGRWIWLRRGRETAGFGSRASLLRALVAGVPR